MFLIVSFLTQFEYRKSSIEPPWRLFNLGPSRGGGGLLERGVSS